MSGGGDKAQPTEQQVTTTTSNLPEYARPYFENLVNRAQAESYREYTPYQDQRIAGFTPGQTQVQQQTMGMQTPGQYGMASGLASASGFGSLAAGQYAPAQVNNQQIGLPNLQNYQMGNAQNVYGMAQVAPQIGTAQTSYAPGLQQYLMSGAPEVSAQQYNSPTMQAASTAFSPDLQQILMGPAGRVSGSQISAADTPQIDAARTSFDPSLQQYQMGAPDEFGQVQASQYMSPYIQSVLDVQKREAVTDARKAQINQDLGAARQGTYGGSRQLLAGMERERALGQQLGDIQARGLQSAYENAQSQFERDRAAGMSAEGQNLQARLGVQQLGAQTGVQTALANLSSEQQARVQNQAALLQNQGMNAEQAMRAALANQQAELTVGQQNQQAGLQTQQLGTQTGLQTALANLSSEQQANVQNQAAQLQTQGLNAEQALRAALSNQQASLTVGQQNQQAQLSTQQLGTQTGLQTALANLSSAQQANVQNQAAILQTQGLNAEQALRAALANQQGQLTTGQQNLNAALQTQQLGAQTGLQALMANQNTNLEAQRLAEQSRQFGGNLGLQGLAQANQSAQTMSNIGSAQQQADLSRLAAQGNVAAQQQLLQQQQMDMAYADFLRQKDYSMEQLGYYSNILRGLPVGLGSTATTYGQPPSVAAQIGGVGLGATALSQMARG
jgi:hypothetical protein